MEIFRKHKNDILLILAVLVVAGGAWLYTWLSRVPGGEVVVSIEGEEVHRLPLFEDVEISVGEGGKSNILTISGGEAWISEASCPDHVCVKSGKVSYDGQTIVCLPNKVVVSIEGGEDSGLDGVTG